MRILRYGKGIRVLLGIFAQFLGCIRAVEWAGRQASNAEAE